MLYDLIIIGAGPAGMTAAIYAARRKIKFLILSLDIGGQISWSSDVDNYPGLPDLPGVEIVKRFRKHINDYNIKPIIGDVVNIKRKGKILSVQTKKNSSETKAIIIASGKKPKKLDVPGEEEFLNKGVNYCAICDAPLLKEKTVAVIGSGNSGLDASLVLSKYAKKVYLIDLAPKIVGEPYLRDKVIENKKITFIGNAKIKEILGDKIVNAIKYEIDGQEKLLKLDSVFIEIGLVSRVDFAKIIKKNKWGEIKIFRKTITHKENMTNIPGVFAAGDVTDIPAKQIAAAVGEGCKAALASFNYIDKFKKK